MGAAQLAAPPPAVPSQKQLFHPPPQHRYPPPAFQAVTALPPPPLGMPYPSSVPPQIIFNHGVMPPHMQQPNNMPGGVEMQRQLQQQFGVKLPANVNQPPPQFSKLPPPLMQHNIHHIHKEDDVGGSSDSLSRLFGADMMAHVQKLPQLPVAGALSLQEIEQRQQQPSPNTAV